VAFWKRRESISTLAIERVAAFYAQLAEGAIVADAAGRILLVNEAAARIHGAVHLKVGPEDYARVYSLRTVDGAPHPPADLPLVRAVRGEIVNEARWRIVRPDGVTVLAIGSASPVRDGHGVQIGAVLTLRDDTARDIAEQELRRLNQGLQTEIKARTAELSRAWELSADFLAVCGLDGLMTAGNPVWSRRLGFDETTLFITPFWDLAPLEDRDHVASSFAMTRGRKAPVNFTSRLVGLDGRVFTVHWTLVAERDLIYISGRDATLETSTAAELEDAHAALRQAQKMEAIGQLTGGVAHDFNNLLTVIRSSVDLLRRPDLDDRRRKRYIDAIGETADRAAQLTAQLLAFARRQPLKAEVFDAVDSVRRLKAMLQTLVSANVVLEIEASCEACAVEADRGQYETALINMAVNARDAMDGRGRLSIQISTAEAIPGGRAASPVAGRFVVVSLNDTGPGIASSQLERIFEPFYTTKAVGKGTGLGLSQVYGFAKQSGGDVRVESSPGQGATFSLYLPATGKRMAEKAEPATVIEPAARRRNRVLMVEDNEEVGAFGRQLLTDLGYVVTLARNAVQAQALLEADPESFDVVFTDVVMPGAINGLQLAKRIRETRPELPVILTSGYSDALANSEGQGFDLLQKPYSVEALSRIIQQGGG
jgi:signal transduction histidine kinase